MGAVAYRQSRRTVRTLTCLTISVVAGIIVTVGAVLHSYFVSRIADSTRRAYAVATAQMLALSLGDGPVGVSLDNSDYCERLLNKPGVLAATLRNPDGTLRCSSAIDHRLSQLLEAWQKQATVNQRIPMDSAVAVPRLPKGIYLVRTTLDASLNSPNAGSVELLITSLEQIPLAGEQGWIFYPGLVAVGIITAWLGVRRLRRCLLLPLARLLAQGNRLSSQPKDEPSPSTVEELEGLAHLLADLQSEVKHWHDRADRFERRLDRRVAVETQRITKDLRRVQREVYKDALTGINNRRMFEEKYCAIVEAQRQARQDLSVVMIDLDHFKFLNDTHGHKAGDDILALVGELLRQCLRADDIAVRYGGDEFILILPGTSATAAAALTKRVTALFAQQAKVRYALPKPVTMSAGIASLRNNLPAHHHQLLKMADQTLYQAKQSGRDAVKICDGAESQVA